VVFGTAAIVATRNIGIIPSSVRLSTPQ